MAILDALPIWAVYLLTVGTCILSHEIGFRLGRLLRRRYPEAEVGGATGALVGGLLGLLGFLLAFSIGLGGGLFQNRLQLVVTGRMLSEQPISGLASSKNRIAPRCAVF